MPTEFEMTRSRIADAFHVNDIASYQLVTCDITANPQSVLEKYQDYDQIPTQDRGRITGVIERIRDSLEQPYRVHALDEGILVSADETLANFLPLLANPPYYRLVLKGTSIQGIVTKSDALKIPVRLYAFALITQLELLMIEKIKEELPDQVDWWHCLSKNRQAGITKKRDRFKVDQFDPSLIELTDFCDKRTIMKKKFSLPKRFVTDLKKIEDLRNEIAHATTFIENGEDLKEFIKTLERCDFWVNEIPSLT